MKYRLNSLAIICIMAVLLRFSMFSSRSHLLSCSLRCVSSSKTSGRLMYSGTCFQGGRAGRCTVAKKPPSGYPSQPALSSFAPIEISQNKLPDDTNPLGNVHGGTIPEDNTVLALKEINETLAGILKTINATHGIVHNLYCHSFSIGTCIGLSLLLILVCKDRFF